MMSLIRHVGPQRLLHACCLFLALLNVSSSQTNEMKKSNFVSDRHICVCVFKYAAEEQKPVELSSVRKLSVHAIVDMPYLFSCLVLLLFTLLYFALFYLNVFFVFFCCLFINKLIKLLHLSCFYAAHSHVPFTQ